MSTDRFETWTDKSAGDRSELHCRDTETGAETSRPNPFNPETLKHIAEWKAEQLRSSAKGRAA